MVQDFSGRGRLVWGETNGLVTLRGLHAPDHQQLLLDTWQWLAEQIGSVTETANCVRGTL